MRWQARALVLAMLGCSLMWAPTAAAGGHPSLAGSSGTVWVTNQTLNTVTAYDARTGAVLRTVNVGAKPIGVVAPPRARTVYVSNESDDTITLIDQATGRTSTIAVGDGPHHMVHSPSGRFVYFGEFNTNTVGAIDARTGDYRSLVASASPTAKTHAVWVGRGGRTLYAVNSEADTFTALALDDAEVAPAAAEEASPPASPSMVLEGDVWTLWYEGNAVRLRDSRGLRFIAMLLADPGREFHVLDLAAPAGGRALVADAGAAIDPAARAAYRRRVEELRRVIDEAEAGGDQEHEARAREELEFIARELAAAYGLKGTARRLDDPAERARKAVTNRIRDAVARIEANQPALGRHLRSAIRTGAFCSYQPERAVAWEVRPGR